MNQPYQPSSNLGSLLSGMREAAHVIREAYKLEPVIPPPAANATPPKPQII